MAYHSVSNHFAYFFSRINPSTTFERRASSEHTAITGLIEDRYGLARELSPICFLQGSYKQQTAIYTINDVDIIALCALEYPASGGSGGSGRLYGRDQIFDIIAAPLLSDSRYKNKVRYDQGSMCIKVDLDIKIEILPVVYKQGNDDPQKEPFCLYRPENSRWEDGYARYHQLWLTDKNSAEKANGNFIPAIKVFKHLRTRYSLDAVSFHIECLLFSLSNALYAGGPADYISNLLNHIAATSADDWYSKMTTTPCGERFLFVETEWNRESWRVFHKALVVWAKCAKEANQASDRETAITLWQALLGEDFFPRQVNV